MVLNVQAKRLNREGRLMDIVDPLIHLNNDEILEAQRVIYAALLCLQNSEELRPTMARVVTTLQGDMGSEPINLDMTSDASSSSRSSQCFPLEGFTVSTNLTTVHEESNEVPLIDGISSSSHHVIDMKRIAGTKSSPSNLSSGISDVDIRDNVVIAR